MNTGHIHPSAKKLIRKNAIHLPIGVWAKQIQSGDITALARAITLVESKNNEDRQAASKLLGMCNRNFRGTVRIGITGPPGVGKSSFIEALGKILLNETQSKIAVLSIDPSSPLQGGSILGDKTRMQALAQDARVFIRPTPAGSDDRGIHLNTRDSIQLCEYAGYEYILVETVGVGQSSFSIHDVTDLTILLIPPGGGDELQGIKRGVTELADLIIVNKDDSGMEAQAKWTQGQYQQAMQMYPDRKVSVLRCSSTMNKGLKEIDDAIHQLIASKKKHRNKIRQNQTLKAFHHKIEATWINEWKNKMTSKSLINIESSVLKHPSLLHEKVIPYITALKKLK